MAYRDGPRANDIDISSNSWGECYEFNTNIETYIKDGSQTLRDGKGRVYVFVAGNNRKNDSLCGGKNSTTLNIMLNNRYSIVVAAMNQNDTFMETSTPGANILVSAYGHNLNGQPHIFSTYPNNLYNDMGVSSTSVATPMVSGAVALLLDECPNLTYRDVKYLLAITANEVDNANSSWITNGAGLQYSTDYGFGKLDITEAINLCTSYINRATQKETNMYMSENATVLNGNNTFNFVVGSNIKVEWVGVTLSGVIDSISEYKFILISPSGTQIVVLDEGIYPNTNIDSSIALDSNGNNNIFRLSMVGFLNETSTGTWQLKVTSTNQTQTNKTLQDAKIQILGY